MSDAPASAQSPAPLPFAFARRAGLLLDGEEGDRVRVLCRPDFDPAALVELRRGLARPLSIVDLGAEDFAQALQRRYEDGARQSQQVVDDLGDSLDLDTVAQQLAEPADLLEHADDAPIIRLINALLTEAIRENASDIHIEPFENRLAVRLRVDGVLREVLAPPRALAPLVASRVKVMAKLDIAEKRLPQDGRISIRIANRPVDVRVSTIPCGHGERVVLRLLDKQAGRLQLEQLGIDPQAAAGIDALVHRSHGIFLVTGPTGSGKTTTLYAALARLNDRSRNVMTVEDPIEYFIDGIAQTQVNPRVEMSFARGLRAILRQDPDVVMVGEIRDLETASIAIQASLTGHLVLSTLHTNTAIGAITRLRDMGAETFLLASSLVGVMAQRLVRLLCGTCKAPAPAGALERGMLGLRADEDAVLYRAVGCPECNRTGYRGRSAIYELVTVDDALRALIHDGAGEQAMQAHVRTATPSLMDCGRDKVRTGLTTVDELLRVTNA
ncbi:MAG: type II secretion system ATPase GspE [Gammaproteobacteria bacterium]